MDKLATMDTIGSSFRPWLSCQGICLLNRHQTGDTDSVQPVILLPIQRDSQETFIPCAARMLWYSADRTSSQQLRDTTPISALLIIPTVSLGVTSAVVSSCGYDSGQIEHRVAHELAGHWATHAGPAKRPPHRHPSHAQPSHPGGSIMAGVRGC